MSKFSAYISKSLHFTGRFFSALFIIIFFLFVIAIAALYFFDANHYRETIERQFQEKTHQTLMLYGDVHVKLLPFPHIEFQNATIRLTQAGEKIDITAQSLSIYADIRITQKQPLRIKSFLAKDVVVTKTGDKKPEVLGMLNQVGGNLYRGKGQLDVSRLSLKTNSGEITGVLWVSWGNGFWDVRGKIHSAKWDFSSPEIPKYPPLRLTVDWLIDDAVVERLHAKALRVQIESTYQSTAMTVQGAVAGGALFARLFQKTPQSPVNLDVHLKEAKADELLKIFSNPVETQGGTLTLDFRGQGPYSGLSAWLQGSSGELLVRLRQLRVKRYVLDSRYVDVLSALLKSFNPNHQGTMIECAAAYLKLDNGRARVNNSIGLQTSELVILGRGAINLKQGEADLEFNLFPRSQSILEVGTFNNVIHLKGPLSRLSVSGGAVPVIHKGASLLLGATTGGASLLAEKLFKLVTQRRSPCETILSIPASSLQYPAH